MFIDAQEMAAKHPDTFSAPSDEVLASIRPGMSVKVCAEPERFWVSVKRRDGDRLEGVVDNVLICIDEHGLRVGDKVRFEIRHIYDVFAPESTVHPAVH